MDAIAKTGQRSLIGHALDVAHAAYTMLNFGVVRDRISTTLGITLDQTQVARLAVLVGLHDFGKALNGFQNRIRGISRGRGHVTEGIAALQAKTPELWERLHKALYVKHLVSWFEHPDAVLYTVLCHHGGPVDDAKVNARMVTSREDLAKTDDYDPIAQIAKLTEALLRAFPLALRAAPAIPASTRFEHALAGLVMTADWMGSDARWHSLDGPADRPDAARRLLNDTVWSGWHSGARPEVVLENRPPHAGQATLLALPLDQHLVVLEAPTGTGKTEAALIWVSRLAQAGLVDGMFFAVPTRSAATELHARVARLLATAHPKLTARVVRAVPGMIDTDHPIRMFDEDESQSWALGCSRRTMSAPVAVGTVDQAMLSQMRVKHGHLRSFCLSRHLLVVDEVHASDPYMGEIIARLVQEHLASASYALLMSATLGETLRARLETRARLGFAAARDRPYPLISAGAYALHDGSPPERTVVVEMLDQGAAILAARDAAAQGRAVLLIRSTVADAIADFRSLAALGVDSMLHHSRYADHDRQLLDAQLLGIIGKEGKRRGVVLVATQTAEQSLDIDADLLVTDACPADVLLQRLGRLHRHRVGTTPLCLMIDPGDWDRFVTAKGKCSGHDGQGWAWVYSPLAVRETVELIRARRRITVPDDVREFVETATHAAHLEAQATAYGERWTNLWQNLYGRDLADMQGANGVLVDRTLSYADATIDPEAATRLGGSCVDLVVAGLLSPFDGTVIEELPIRATWLREVTPGTEGIVIGVDGSGNSIIAVGSARFTYGREGLNKVKA
jgi:CRISPR-associated endonuclease/helicase Cas3